MNSLPLFRMEVNVFASRPRLMYHLLVLFGKGVQRYDKAVNLYHSIERTLIAYLIR